MTTDSQEDEWPCPILQALQARVAGPAASVGEDRILDRAITAYFFPEAGPCSPHCPGDEPIFWHDPLHKRPAPRLTSRLDAVLWLLRTTRPGFAWRVESPGYHHALGEGDTRFYGAVKDLVRARAAWVESQSPLPGDADARRGAHALTNVGAYAASEARALLAALLRAERILPRGKTDV